LWLLEETEPIYGLALIAFQNYIYNTINDVKSSRFITDKKYHEIYKGDRQIELIIHLANYYKHRFDTDFERDKNYTYNFLKDSGLYNEKIYKIDESPIFKGLELLSPNWDLSEVLDIASNWRENYLKSKISNK